LLLAPFSIIAPLRQNKIETKPFQNKKIEQQGILQGAQSK
jgi:hypothetical protein